MVVKRERVVEKEPLVKESKDVKGSLRSHGGGKVSVGLGGGDGRECGMLATTHEAATTRDS